MKPLPLFFLPEVLPELLLRPLCHWVLTFSFACLFHSVFAQQEPQFTQYMFNSLVYNPAYAGSKEYLSAVAIYRDQWFGWGNGVGEYDRRPITQTFSIHSPVNRRVGLGLNVVNDRIGARQASLVNACYTYRIRFGKGDLALGLLGGFMHWRADWDQLDFKDARELDLSFDGPNPSLWLPDFGAGLYFHMEKFYAGASIPHLAQFNLRKVSNQEQVTLRKWAKTYRHFYLTAGGAIPLNGDNVVFKPSFLIKTVGFFNGFFKQGNLVREIGAPASFDLDAAFLFQKKFWLGAAFRSSFAAFKNQGSKRSSHDSLDAWTAFYLKNGLRIGFAYDYPLSEIQNYSDGSFEIMMGYDFVRNLEKLSHPRYF